MPELIVRLENEEGNFTDASRGKKLINVRSAIYLTALRGGMGSGKASIALGFVVGGNKFILAETSLKLFLLGAAAVAAKFPDEAREIPFYAGARSGDGLTMIMQPSADSIAEAIALLGNDLQDLGEQGAENVKQVITFLECMKQSQGEREP